MQPEYIRYTDDVEEIDDDEQATFDKIAAAMAKGGDIVRERYGHAVRTSHARRMGCSRASCG